MGFFNSGESRIHYETFGEGPPLVLVHGWGANTHSNWIATGWVDALKAQWRVISLEPRGHGKSDKPNNASAYTYAAMAADVIALLDHLSIPDAAFMGYSMGAFMGAHLLGHHTGRFNSMILGGIGNESDESADACVAIAEALRARDAASLNDPFQRSYRAYAESVPDNNLEALAVSALTMWRDGYPLELGGDGLGRVDIPVLIINGANDHPYVDSADALAAAIPLARHVRITGANHITALTHPHFKKVVLEFLKQVL